MSHANGSVPGRGERAGRPAYSVPVECRVEDDLSGEGVVLTFSSVAPEAEWARVGRAERFVERVATTGLAWQQVTGGSQFEGWELTVSTVRDHVVMNVLVAGPTEWLDSLSTDELHSLERQAGRCSWLAWVCWGLAGALATRAGVLHTLDLLGDDAPFPDALAAGQVMDQLEQALGDAA